MKYKGIDFDINGMDEKEVLKLFDKIMLKLPNLQIFEVYIEDDEYGEIRVDVNEDVEHIGDTLLEMGIETSPSDEDYGEMQSINLYF